MLPAAKQCRRAAPSVKIGRPRRVLTQAQNFPRNSSVEGGGRLLGDRSQGSGRGEEGLPLDGSLILFFKAADGFGAPLHKVATRIFAPSREAEG